MRAASTISEQAWRRTEPAIAVSGEVSLRGLPEHVVGEVLYDLQDRTVRDIKTMSSFLRPLCNQFRITGIASVTEIDHSGLKAHLAELARSITTSVRRASASPESERHKDTWDLSVFGRWGQLHFEKVSHPAFKEALKIWALDGLPRRRGRGSRNSTQAHVNAMIKLTDGLWDQRDDHGLNLSELGRRDILAFRNRLAFRVEQGDFSHHHLVTTCRFVRRTLMRMRAIGPADMPADFTINHADLPDEVEDTGAGKDLPDEVMRVLCEHLDLLERLSSREIQVATELMIDTGRWPVEICQRSFECLYRNPDGTFVLLYDNHKNFRLGRRLPIGAATAGVITAQQERVRQRFRETPAAQLKLLPAPAGKPRREEVHRWGRRAAPSMGERTAGDRGTRARPVGRRGGQGAAAIRQGEDLPLCLPTHLRPTPCQRRSRR